eukprot:g3575.t1
MTPRTALVITLKNVNAPHNSVKVASLHLPGGRFDEIYLNKPHVSIDNLSSIKTDLLNQVLKHSPNIVIGDFNSDIICFTDGEVNLRQRKFWTDNLGFPDTNETTAKLIAWNTAPYRLLDQKNYSIMCKHQCSAKFKECPSSVYGTTPDAIWFRNGSVTFDSYEQILLIGKSAMLSDHNALIAMFHV